MSKVQAKLKELGVAGDDLIKAQPAGAGNQTVRAVWDLPETYRGVASDLHNSDTPTACVLTYGCQLNERDTETVIGQLLEMGYQQTDSEYEADIVLLNTCAVRKHAEDRVWGKLGELKKLKSKKPDMLIGLCGCMAQEDGTVDTIRRQMPFVDMVFGTHNIHELPKIVRQVQETEGTVIDVWKSAGPVVEHLPSQRMEGTKAWVNIIYGCNKFCTFCIVPHVRGKERSRQPEDVIQEVEQLVSEGHREVMLLGQTVNSYGQDLDRGYDFADLLADINEIDRLKRIRFMSPHPIDFTDKLIDTIARSDKVCEHIHLPLQSGSNDILYRMNRRYTREEYLELVERIRRRIPNACITTDIIAGFPGESDDDFQLTLDVVKQVQFDGAFTFVYSPREKTPAARWEQLPNPVKKERLQRLMEVQNRFSRQSNEAMVGHTEEVLVEGPSKNNASVMASRTRSNKLVLIPAGDEAAIEHYTDRFLRAKITRAHTWTLDGELVEQAS